MCAPLRSFLSHAMQVQQQALFPKFNILKQLHSRWQMFRLPGLMRGEQQEKAQQIVQGLWQQTQAALASRPEHTEGSLGEACWRLTDFGRAVPFGDLLPGLPKGAGAEVSSEAGALLKAAPARYNKDGLVVFSDPAYQPPEVSGGLRGVMVGVRGGEGSPGDNILSEKRGFEVMHGPKSTGLACQPCGHLDGWSPSPWSPSIVYKPCTQILNEYRQLTIIAVQVLQAGSIW